ncbi:MAG: hypothetical protein ACREUP_04975, partial [Burkholderiales bacterium]
VSGFAAPSSFHISFHRASVSIGDYSLQWLEIGEQGGDQLVDGRVYVHRYLYHGIWRASIHHVENTGCVDQRSIA